MAAALIAALARLLCGHLGWIQSASIAAVLAVSIGFNRGLLSATIGKTDFDMAEGVRWALLQCVAVYVIHPYVCCAQVGAGDAYHYSLSAGDFIRQFHSGIFPVFIGQSEFAFNGGIHSVRTAPYFVHLCAGIDAVTFHTLPFYAVANLAVIFSATLGTIGTYAALRVYVAGRAMTAFALSTLYILSPAILAPLYEGDMIATFLAVPMLPWWVLGLAMAADEPLSWRPWLIHASALAAMWWAHPPIACWATATTLGAWVLIVVRSGSIKSVIERITVATLLCAALASYEFVSVFALQLHHAPISSFGISVQIPESIRRHWKAIFLPLSSEGYLLDDIQLGYSLMVATLVGFFAVRTRKSAGLLLFSMAGLLLLLLPIPGVTGKLWSWVPIYVLEVTNAWPMQRLYPMLAALAVFAAMAGASRLNIRTERRAALGTLIVSAGILWSALEIYPFYDRRERSSASTGDSTGMFRPENLTLTRVSYLFFGFYPGYFSNSPMEPFLETRLLDARTLAVVADGSTTASGAVPNGTYKAELRMKPNGDIEPKIQLKPSETAVLKFDFDGDVPSGVLQLSGGNLRREYRLPRSGEEKAFGTEPGSGRVIAIPNTSSTLDQVKMNFRSDTSSGFSNGESRNFARVSVEPYSSNDRVINLLSLLPFHAVVHADREGVLETPKIDVPGYRVFVNGRKSESLKTADGLLAVPLPEGISDVVVDYPGGRILRWSYAGCIAAWFGFGICAIALPVSNSSNRFRKILSAPHSSISRGVTILPFAVVFVLILATGAYLTRRWWGIPNDGALRIVVRMPVGNKHTSEPLLTTGVAGAGDVIFLNYLGPNRISVGHDSWGHSATSSKAFSVNSLIPQTVEVSMKSLASPKLWGSKAPSGVSVKWNGREILSDERSPYPSGPSGAAIGTNPIGASTCEPAFTGEVLESEPVEPWTK